MSRASTPPRVENVSVRRGSPSATRPPPAGRQGPGRGSALRSARHRGRARLCPKTRTYAPRRGGRRRASATAQNGAARGIATSGGASRELHRARVDSLANPSVFPGARARTCACAALVWAHAPVRGRAREAPIAQPLHPSTCRTRAASRRAPHPPSSARCGRARVPTCAPRARARTSHGPRSATRRTRVDRGGPSARPRAARALAKHTLL